LGASQRLKDAQTTQSGIVQKNLDLSSANAAGANQAFGQRTSLLQKPTDFYTALASGDRTKMLEAAAPAIANISKQFQSTRGAINDSVAPGAARDFAVASTFRDQAGKNADFLNQAYMSSFPALQGMASDAGNFGLQREGAALNGLNSAGSQNQSVIQSEVARQQAKMGMIGSLAGAAGGAITGGGLGGLFKGAPGASGAGSFSGPSMPSMVQPVSVNPGIGNLSASILSGGYGRF